MTRTILISLIAIVTFVIIIIPTEGKPTVPADLVPTDTTGKFQAFISYRRNASKHLAMLIKVLLERENVPAFIDVEDLKGGPWDSQLIDGITSSPNFILILSNQTLTKAKGDTDYKDFLNIEIKKAVDTNKRIILVYDDFDFPNEKDFSPSIQAALKNQGITWQHKFVDQSLERLLSYMNEPRNITSDHKFRLPSRQ